MTEGFTNKIIKICYELMQNKSTFDMNCSSSHWRCICSRLFLLYLNTYSYFSSLLATLPPAFHPTQFSHKQATLTPINDHGSQSEPINAKRKVVCSLAKISLKIHRHCRRLSGGWVYLKRARLLRGEKAVKT